MGTKMKKVLVVDDNERNIRLLDLILSDEGYDVYTVDEGLEVVGKVQEIMPDIILLDIMMPNLDGFGILKILKGDFNLKNIPVIMVTAKVEGQDIRKALEMGAFDYIKKPIDEDEVIARLASALKFKDKEDILREMATKDPLTGLYNHALLVELFDKEYSKQQREKGDTSFVMLDIDYFKKVNDIYGHLVGDFILKEFANLLEDSVRRGDIVGRYGGEEFSIVFHDAKKEAVCDVCERIRKRVEEHRFIIDGHNINITISIGISFKEYEQDISTRDVIKKADYALYKAKRNGRNRVEIL